MNLDIYYGNLGIRVTSRVVEWGKNYDLRKLEIIRNILNLGGDIAQCPVSLPEVEL